MGLFSHFQVSSSNPETTMAPASADAMAEA